MIKKTVTLYIGEQSVLFRKENKYPMSRVSSVSELREIVTYYEGITFLDRPVILEDLSFITGDYESVLLKFLEETKLSIILLAMYDTFSATLLSRVSGIHKELKGSTHSEFLGLKQGFQRLEDLMPEGIQYYSKVAMMSQYSPLLYATEQRLKGIRNQEKIIRILGD